MPDLSSSDLDRIHRLWIEAVSLVGPDLHHRDVVNAAVARLEQDLHGDQRAAAVETLRAQATPLTAGGRR